VTSLEQHDVVVVGGGNAGISLAARLLRLGARDVALLEPNEVHRYRPLLNYVGAGEASMGSLERPMGDVVPDGCTWVRDEVTSVDPAGSTLTTAGGRTLGWATLVVCCGLEEDWAAIPGLEEAYASGWAGSTFVVETAPLTWPALSSLRSGTVVFSVPPEPAPCGVTALKPLTMACDHWRREGVLGDLDVHLVLPGATVTGHAPADRRLEGVLASYGVQVVREARVARLDAVDRSVHVEGADGTRSWSDVAHAHVVPHYRAPRWVADSGLAGDSPAGLVDVDPESLRHRRHPAVWSIGDVADLHTRPSGGGLRPQVDVLAHNLAADRAGEPLRAYDGYTVMPITTSRRELLLVEVDRDGRPQPTTPFPDLTRPRRSTWLFDRYGLVQVYFRRILRGKV
jgi:sulfide:quinone oxidoreductase